MYRPAPHGAPATVLISPSPRNARLPNVVLNVFMGGAANYPLLQEAILRHTYLNMFMRSLYVVAPARTSNAHSDFPQE